MWSVCSLGKPISKPQCISKTACKRTYYKVVRVMLKTVPHYVLQEKVFLMELRIKSRVRVLGEAC